MPFFVLLIFPFGGHSSADMALSFIDLQNGFYFGVQFWINIRKTLGNIFMYGAFANAKPCRRFAHSGFIFQYIFPKFNGSFLNGRIKANSG